MEVGSIHKLKLRPQAQTRAVVRPFRIIAMPWDMLTEPRMAEESTNYLKRGTRVRIEWDDGTKTYGKVTQRAMRHQILNSWWYFVREDGRKKSVRIQGASLTVIEEH